MYFLNIIQSNELFKPLPQSFYIAQKLWRASSTPSAPINSSRGAADTTAGLIYFSTPFEQVRVSVGDLVPPPLMLTLHYLGEKLSCVNNVRRRNNYPGRARVGQKVEKKPHGAQHCHKVPKIPYSISLYIEPNYTLSLYIEPNYTLC